MQSVAPRLAAARGAGRPLANPPSASRKGNMAPWSAVQGPSASGPGDRLLPLIRSPLDLLVLPGRVALGTLQSLPEIIERLPADVERLQMLAQDPRSMDVKQAEVLTEIEDRVVSYLQKGTDTEAGVLDTVAAAIPEPLRDVLPEQIKDVLNRNNSTSSSVNGGFQSDWGSSGAAAAASNGAGSAAQPLATWTISSDDESLTAFDEQRMRAEPPSLSTLTPAAITATQTAAEVVEVNAAVAAVRMQLSELQGNIDPSRDNMIRLNLREAEDLLGRRLDQMSPAHRSVSDASVQAAIREAEALLSEVRALRP
ncbi:hypothetical protein D9Q98_010144 [Chlorella vulgaris]|uniref:Uncharacterized protein n=1 Tax=Chlorella vulgaris TaxID=3077 RepID=A0A9D4YWD8_CHLVU|nr:hypothetical protein D9Q98_010144 [Chlorella vulgaris]